MRYFDLHCDTPTKCFDGKLSFVDAGLSVSAAAASGFAQWHQCFAIFVSDGCAQPFQYYRAVYRYFSEQLHQFAPDNLTPHWTVENGRVLAGNLQNLKLLYADGVRAMTLTWNGANELAGGAYSAGNLTDFGRAVIAEMNRLGMACDLSHLNEQSFYTALESAEYPLATHSNSRAVSDVPRNLTDAQCRALAARGGIIGLCFYPPFVGGTDFAAIGSQVNHFLELGLEDALAIGSDFDGADMGQTLSFAADVPQLYGYLASCGLKSGLLDKIFFENAAKFWNRL